MTLQHTTSTVVLHHSPLLGLCYVYALLPPSLSLIFTTQNRVSPYVRGGARGDPSVGDVVVVDDGVDGVVVGGNYKTYLLRSVLRRSSLRCFLTSATSMVTLPGVHS